MTFIAHANDSVLARLFTSCIDGGGVVRLGHRNFRRNRIRHGDNGWYSGGGGGEGRTGSFSAGMGAVLVLNVSLFACAIVLFFFVCSNSHACNVASIQLRGILCQ